MISPDVIKEEMGRVRRACKELDQLARVVAKTYEEAYDASLSKTVSGDGAHGNRRGLPIGDPTGDTATSGMHRRMRWRIDDACKDLERVVKRFRRLKPALEDAEDMLVEAFMETDPEFREKLRRLRELEAAAEGQGLA